MRAAEDQAVSRRRPFLGEARGDLRLGRRPDARDVAQPAGRGGLAQLVRGADAERAAELDHALRAESDQAAESDQLGLHLGLQLVDLGQAARLDQLLQPCLDRWPDASQLPHPPLPDELGDRGRRRADQLGSTPVRAHAVATRSCEIEQRRERLQPLCDQRVVGACRHGGSVHDRWRPSLFLSAAAIPSADWRLLRSTIGYGSPRRCWATCSRLRAGSAGFSSSLRALRPCPTTCSTSPTRAAARVLPCATRSTQPSPPARQRRSSSSTRTCRVRLRATSWRLPAPFPTAGSPSPQRPMERPTRLRSRTTSCSSLSTGPGAPGGTRRSLRLRSSTPPTSSTT